MKCNYIDMDTTVCASFVKTRGIHHHHHHHVAIKEMGHLLTRSVLTHQEVSAVVFLGSFCLLGCSFFISLGNLLPVVVRVIIR
jgi:hypothetical protein